jgi:hypothetical protein
MKIRALLISSLLGFAGVATTQADPILGGQIFATGGSVYATFTGSDAGYDNLLFFATTSSGTIFEGHATVVGTTVYLGDFAAGTELEFGLNNQQGNIWYTGSGSRNTDGLAHALVDGSTPGIVSVGFEDLNGGGDKDYNDLEFTVRNATVPDTAGTLLLLGGALIGLLGFSRRFAR